MNPKKSQGCRASDFSLTNNKGRIFFTSIDASDVTEFCRSKLGEASCLSLARSFG